MNTISNSQRLRQKIERVLPEMAAASNALVRHPYFRQLYPEFLVTNYQLAGPTVPLMQTALQRCLELAGTDPVAAALAPYLDQHIKEEMHSHWFLEDLEFLGEPRAEVLRRIPPPTVAAYVGAQYYWILHHHPVAYLGQLEVGEGYPPPVEATDRLVALTGYPRPAFRTLERHSHIDLHHRDDLNEVLDRLPLQEEHHALLEVSALHTVQLVTKVFREVLERAAETVAQDAGLAVSA